MSDYEILRAQMHDCTECLKAFLLEAAERQPELEEHAGIIREHTSNRSGENSMSCPGASQKKGHLSRRGGLLRWPWRQPRTPLTDSQHDTVQIVP